MTEETELLERITVRAEVFGGKPIIRDMRIAVEHVLGKLGGGRWRGNHTQRVSLS